MVEPWEIVAVGVRRDVQEGRRESTGHRGRNQKQPSQARPPASKGGMGREGWSVVDDRGDGVRGRLKIEDRR
jgi:hypothetical protein